MAEPPIPLASYLRLETGDGVTVTDVALRWGITHTGRFAREYRRMFGPRRCARGADTS
jgi:AraC-like DNA-binding protein